MPALAGWGWPSAFPCNALFISLAEGAGQGTPSPTLNGCPESSLRRRLTCPLPDPFRLGRQPSPLGAPRVPAHSTERASVGLRDARRDTPSTAGAGPHPFCPLLSTPTSALLNPASPHWWPLALLGAGTVGMRGALWGPGWGVCHVQTISKVAFPPPALELRAQHLHFRIDWEI